MNKYTLEAVLNDGGIINLNFLVSDSSSLLEIDRFTSQYGKWDFIRNLENYLNPGDVDIISSFRIVIIGREYSYSVVFQNPFLKSVLDDITVKNSSKKYVVSSSTPSFSDMKDFLFQDLDRGGEQFLKYYQYHNRLSRLVHRYLQSSSDNEEELHQKNLLKSTILHEMTDYKTYRSLCVYRNGLDRKINAVYQGPKPKPVSNVKPRLNNFGLNTFTLDQGVSFSYAGYRQVYVNDSDDEKEEFLDSDEIEEMGNYYGK